MIFECGSFRATAPTEAAENDNSGDTAEIDLLIWDKPTQDIYLVSCKLEEHAHSREQSFMRHPEALSRSAHFSSMMAAVQSFRLVAVSLLPQQWRGGAAVRLSGHNSMGFYEEQLRKVRTWQEHLPKSILFADLLQQMDLPLPLPIQQQAEKLLTASPMHSLDRLSSSAG